MNSVEIQNIVDSTPSAKEDAKAKSATSQAGDGPGRGSLAVPHFLVVLLFQDGRSADLVVPGVTGMGGGGDAAGPGRLNIYAPSEGPGDARRLVDARLFSDLADLTIVAESLEIEIDEVPENESVGATRSGRRRST